MFQVARQPAIIPGEAADQAVALSVELWMLGEQLGRLLLLLLLQKDLQYSTCLYRM